MAKLIFEDDGLNIEVTDGSLVRDAIDSNDASIEFGCREGECATCIVEILSGQEFLSQVNDEERASPIPF